MTELEKAAGYVQMLKQEGKLDENALPELLQMYNVSETEGKELIESFKQTTEYKKSVTKNIGAQLVILIVFLCIALFYYFIGTDKDGIPLFSFFGIWFFLGAIGLGVYIFKLLRERFTVNPKYSFLKNKALLWCIISLIYAGVLQYNLSNKKYLLNTNNWKQKSNLVLDSDCEEISTGGKHPTHYYQFTVEQFTKKFRWYDANHLYKFNPSSTPSIYLQKKDTINVWIDSTANKDYFEVANIQKDGRLFLNLNERNLKAAKKSTDNRNISALLFCVALIAFFVLQARANKEVK
jgi:hypothetical protein